MSSRFEANHAGLGSPAGDKGSVFWSRPPAGMRVPGLVPVHPEIRAPERAPGHPGAPPAIPTTSPWLRRRWQRARKAAASWAMGTVATMGTHGSVLTKVQELLDGKRRWREARVALDLLRHRLLEQPPEQPHPRRGSAQTSRDAQAAAEASAAEQRRSGTFVKRTPRPPPRPRRRGCSRRSSESSSTSSPAAAGRPRLPQAPPTGRSRLPHVRGALGARGAQGARGRTRRPLIGRRRRLRFLLPECAEAPALSSGSWVSAGLASAAASGPAPD